MATIVCAEPAIDLDADTRRILARYLLGNIDPAGEWQKLTANEQLLFLAHHLDPKNPEIQFNVGRWGRELPPQVGQFYDQQKSAEYFYELASFLAHRGGEANVRLAAQLAGLASTLGDERVDRQIQDLKLAPADWSFIQNDQPRDLPDAELRATRSIDALTVRMGGLGDWSGSLLKLGLTIETKAPGRSGQVLLEGALENIGPAFRASARTTGEALRKLHPHGHRLALKFTRSGTGRLDGGSAGLAMAVMARAALDDIALAEKVAVTGTFQPPSTVGQVSGIAYKLQAARGKVVIVPFGAYEEVQDLLLLEQEELLWDRQVIGCRTLDEAMEVARKDRPEKIEQAMRLFENARPGNQGHPTMKTREVLEQVVELVPGHYSAQILLQKMDGERPKRLSHATSVGKVGSVMQAFVLCLAGTSKYGFRVFDELAPKILGRIQQLQGRVSPAAESWLTEVRTILTELHRLRVTAGQGRSIKKQLRALMVRAETLDSLLERQLSALAFLIERSRR